MIKNVAMPLTQEQIAKALFINGDERLLHKKIKKGDKTALVQLVMLYMPYIVACAQQEKHAGLLLTALIDAATQGFIIAAEKAANENTDVLDSMHKFMHTAINDTLKNAPAIIKERVAYNTPERTACLNRLNRLLIAKEKQIEARVAEYLELIEQRITGKDAFTTDYNLEAEVAYYARGSNGNPMHVYRTCFRYEDKSDSHKFMLSDDSESWYGPGLPILEKPYCYLLHDLIDHSRIGNKLFSISQIWIDIRFTDQHCIKSRDLK